MAENLLSNINLDGTEIIIADTKARTTADTSNTTATEALHTANSAMETALKKALITYDSTSKTMIVTQGGK